jgi:hypothetical protein
LLCHREDALTVFSEVSNKRFQKACQSAIQSNDKESFPHIFAMCGPGSGKSRICDESFGALKDPKYNTNDTFRDLINRNSIAVVISFNGTTKAFGDAGVPIQARVGARLLSSYFTGVGNMNQIIQLERKFDNLSIADALTAIVVFHEQRNLISPVDGAKFRGVVHVVVDDIGSLVNESFSVQSSSDSSKELTPIRSMLDMFAMLLMSGVNGYFVTNLTTGTIFGDVKAALRLSSHPYVNLRLPLLREIDCQKICTQMLGNRKWNALSEERKLKVLFLLTEIAIPRYVVLTLVHLSLENLEDNLQNTLLTQRKFVIDEITNRFMFPKNSVLKSTLKSCIETCIVNASCCDVILPEVIDLVDSGWLYLDRESPIITRISIPPVVLYALENLASDRFLMKPDVRYFINMLRGSKPDWKFFEEIIASHEAAKASIYRQLSPSISLEKYYSGAIVGVDARNIILKFNNNEHPVLTSKHRFPETEEELKVFDNENPCVNEFVLLNAAGAVCDLIALCPGTVGEQKTSIWRCFQVRHTVDELQSDLNKDVNTWLGKLHPLETKMPGAVVPVFVTNRAEVIRKGLTGSDAANRCVIVTPNCFVNYFGSTIGNSLRVMLKRISKK